MKPRRQIPAVLVTAALLAQLALPAADMPVPRPNGKPADMTKKVKVFILLGQSNMVGAGKVKGGDGSLEHAVKAKKKYPYLVDEAGHWVERQDVRFVRYMSGRGPLNNEWMTVAKCGTIDPQTQKPDPASMQQVRVQLDYDGGIKFIEPSKEEQESMRRLRQGNSK